MADGVAMNDQHPFPLADGCQKCPQRVRERNHIVHGYGDPRAKVMVVGAMPDSEGANQTGVPWTRSIAGQRMQILLRALRLRTASDPDHERPRLVGAYLTNVLRCSTHTDRAPQRAEVAGCIAYLWREIALVNPAIIVPVGEMATRLICAKLLETVPGPMEILHAQIFSAGGRLIVPCLDMAVISKEEAHVLARVLAALLEDL